MQKVTMIDMNWLQIFWPLWFSQTLPCHIFFVYFQYKIRIFFAREHSLFMWHGAPGKIYQRPKKLRVPPSGPCEKLSPFRHSPPPPSWEENSYIATPSISAGPSCHINNERSLNQCFLICHYRHNYCGELDIFLLEQYSLNTWLDWTTGHSTQIQNTRW